MLKFSKLSSVFVLLATISACGIQQSNSAESKIASTEFDNKIVKAVEGCYEVISASVEQSQNTNHPLVTNVLTAKKLCLVDTLTPDGGVSRSGRINVSATNSAGEIVLGELGFDVSAEQPRCLGCYQLSGFDGSILFNGEKRVFDPNEDIDATLDIRMLQTRFKLVLAQNSLCEVTPGTLVKISELRTSELPYKLVEVNLEKLLVQDKCIRTELSDAEIYKLIQDLLSAQNVSVESSAIVNKALLKK